MDELLKAIKTLYSGTSGASLRALTAGGLWLSQAPQSASGVYIVMTPIAAPIDYAKGTSATKVYTQDCSIQFTFATLNGSTSDILAACNAFYALYDFCTFTMTGFTLLVSRRMKVQGPMRDDLTRGYTSYVEYKFTIGG